MGINRISTLSIFGVLSFHEGRNKREKGQMALSNLYVIHNTFIQVNCLFKII